MYILVILLHPPFIYHICRKRRVYTLHGYTLHGYTLHGYTLHGYTLHGGTTRYSGCILHGVSYVLTLLDIAYILPFIRHSPRRSPFASPFAICCAVRHSPRRSPFAAPFAAPFPINFPQLSLFKLRYSIFAAPLAIRSSPFAVAFQCPLTLSIIYIFNKID